jgi:hypothetical protein
MSAKTKGPGRGQKKSFKPLPRGSESEKAAREPEEPENPLALRLLLGATAVVTLLRFYATSKVGFGDSEALYASYAVHPQPAYLDHPGLIGQFASAIGGGTAPSPGQAHTITTVLAALVPWFVTGVARLAGAKRFPALIAGFVVAVVPEIAVGLFAMTPDLLLAPLWLGAIGLAIKGLERKNAVPLIAAGLCVGIASTAKVSGLLLFASLAWVYARSEQRKSFWPWAGLLAGAVSFAPVALYETHAGWPMLRHRLIDTQAHAGVALKNLGALLGGQLLYLSPVIAFIVVLLARDLFRHRNDDLPSRILWATFAIPLVPLLFFCIWSPVAEPHWIAPALLALPIHAARRTVVTPRLLKIAVGVAGAFTAITYAWVLIPESARLLPESVDRKVDISNELFGWPSLVEAVKEQRLHAATPSDPEGKDVVLVGPHWTICAQLQAAMPDAKVGCATPVRDDFDTWYPREKWRAADTVLFITDERFPTDGASELPLLSRYAQSHVRTMRGGRSARVFQLYLYARRAQAAL